MYTIELYDELYENDLFEQVIPIQLIDELTSLNEAEYNKSIEKLKLEIIDANKFIKANDCKQITNPITFVRNGYPSDDGLLSNIIFGITKEDRAGTFAYIDLGGTFIDPSCYKVWSRMDSRIKEIVHQTKKYILDDSGELIENDKGKTGIKFLKDNFDKIKFRTTESIKRDLKIKYLKSNKDRMFINKYIVIPAYYRDSNNSGKNQGVGAINKIYVSLLLAVNSLKSTRDFGFDDTGAIEGRIQEILVTIYDWFVGNTNASIKEEGTGMSKKKGIIRRANMSKTTDYSSRLVLSAPDMKVECVDDLMVNLEQSALPLAATIADFYPYIVFNIKKFFENEFGTVSKYPVMGENGELTYYTPKDPLIEFSEERIKKELKRFVHGFSNRFIPIEVPLEDGPKGKKYYMKFKGRKSDELNDQNLINRKLTWVDVFYQAAVEATRDKVIFITRFPIDSYFNQYPTKLVVSSTKETEQVYIDGHFYPFYPKIREDQIGKDTSKLFVDTMMISNLFLKAIGGDYDGVAI